jgi:hypothetical protein
MKILKFQSKPTKPKKFIYTLQKNGMYKSNGPRGNEYSLANFNNLNPVLEVEHNGVVFKKDLVLVGIGKVVSMAMTLTRDNVVITGNAKSIASRTVLATNAKIDEPSKEDSKKLHDFVLSKAAEKYLLESMPIDTNNLFTLIL